MGRTCKKDKLLKKVICQHNKLKEKLQCRANQIKYFRQKNQYLIYSRDSWREKYKAEKRLRQEYERQLARPCKNQQAHLKVRHHSYKSLIMLLALRIRSGGMISLRSCQKLLLIFQTLLEIDIGQPCINTIRNWEYKQAYFQLQQQADPGDEYAIIIDESFCIGKQTLMLILGVNLSKYKWGKSLDFDTTQVLAMGVNPYWKGVDLAQFIGQLIPRHYRISYAVSDGGYNLVKAFKIRGITRVEDCTHAFSKLIEKRYKEDAVFKEFCARCSLLNRQCWMSSLSAICPPKFRGKSRFLNLYPIAKWAEKNLTLFKGLAVQPQRNEQQEQYYDKLQWLEQYAELIDQLVLLSRLLKACFKLLKHQGLSESTLKEVETILAQEKKVPAFFDQGVRLYLASNSALLTKHNQLLCCSDIIESYFGKYKNQQAANPARGITASCLRIANYGNSFQEKDLIKAMQQVKMIDLKEWKKKNLLETTNAKRKKMYKKCS